MSLINKRKAPHQLHEDTSFIEARDWIVGLMRHTAKLFDVRAGRPRLTCLSLTGSHARNAMLPISAP